ncbi:hypothetical protein [Myroides odoratus]|uniref:hypothetical protein n=1 Tax=Myroides odoratus TaxID=256 RepID=UPI0039B05EC1
MEIDFNNSNLKSTLTTTKAVEKFYYATKSASEQQPNSKFWKDALFFIEKRFKKLKSPKSINEIGPYI